MSPTSKMFTKFLLLSCFLLQIIPIRTQDGFTRSEILADYYTLEWTVDFEMKEIVFTAKAHTVGYVGFGISLNKGAMDGADMIIGGVDDDGTAYFTDGHGVGHQFVEDKSQDWKLLDAFESNGWTIVKFKRTFRPCDQEEDIPITEDTLRVMYSYGKTDQAEYHNGNRGVQSLNLLNPSSRLGEDTSGFESFNVRIKVGLPDDNTVYWEAIRCFSNFKSKLQVVGFEAILSTTEAQKHVHHMLGYRCSIPQDPIHAAYLQGLANTTGAKNNDPSMQLAYLYCQEVIFGWSVGGYPVFLPDDIGLPFGGSDHQECVRLEIHFNNPENANGLEVETGMTLYYTENLRRYNGGHLTVGTHTLPHLIVPPGMKDFVHTGHCSSECTSAAFPQDGIKVFGVIPHTHIHGRKIKIRHFRGTTELPWIVADDHYDFNYQQYNPIREPVQVLPGDQLIAECVYDTASKDPPEATHQGESTVQEMCLAFLFTYPALSDLFYCVSFFESPEQVLQPLGIGSLNSLGLIDPIVMSPPEMRGLTLLDALNLKVNWTEEKVNHLQDQMRWEKQTGLCMGNLNQTFVQDLSYPKIFKAYEPKFTCQKTSGGNPTTAMVTSLLSMMILLVTLVGRNIV